MNNSKQDKFYEKYAWVIFVLIGIMIIAGGIPHMLGVNTDPALVEAISGETIEGLKLSSPMHYNLYNFYFQSGGISDIGVALFLISISIFAYRKGEKWSWFSMWIIPIFFLAFILISLQLPEAARNSLIPPLSALLAAGLIGLLLPIRKFFPKNLENSK